jgi:DNA-binding response OmpR family regulator
MNGFPINGTAQRHDGAIKINGTPARAVLPQLKPKRSVHILCIDDDEQFLETMKDCLTHFEHRVTVASGGKRGLELFSTAMMKSQPYEVVITDLGMPDMDGQRVARTIKAESPNTPIIMMTGRDTITKQDGEMAPAVDAVVGKPPHIQELNDLILRITTPAPPRL